MSHDLLVQMAYCMLEINPHYRAFHGRAGKISVYIVTLVLRACVPFILSGQLSSQKRVKYICLL